MFLELGHTKLPIFNAAKSLALECYRVTKSFPPEERYVMTQQIRRAALSVHLNVAEGCSRKSIGERKRFYVIARGSVIEIDTAFDLALELDFATLEKLKMAGVCIVNVFKQLSGMIE